MLKFNQNNTSFAGIFVLWVKFLKMLMHQRLELKYTFAVISVECICRMYEGGYVILVHTSCIGCFVELGL